MNISKLDIEEILKKAHEKSMEDVTCEDAQHLLKQDNSLFLDYTWKYGILVNKIKEM